MADFRYYAGITLDDYIEHHGILGMMWGKRNGPPYPLDAGDHSAREKKVGWRKSLNGADNSDLYNKKNTSSDTVNKSKGSAKAKSEPTSKSSKKDAEREIARKAANDSLKRLALVYGGLAVAGGAYHLYSVGAVDRGIAVVEDYFNKANQVVPDIQKRIQELPKDVRGTYNSLVNNGFKQLSKPETYREALRRINPFFLTAGGQNNCYSCAFAYTLRTLFGLDVTAVSDIDGERMDVLAKAVKNSEKSVLFSSSLKEASGIDDYLEAASKAILEKFKDDGAQGMIGVQWLPMFGGGHAFNWKIENGKVIWIDPQRGVEGYVEKAKFFKHANIDGAFMALRLDNADFDMDVLNQIVKKH